MCERSRTSSKNPDAGIEVDVEKERVTYDETDLQGSIERSTREALVEGKWDTVALMRSNTDRVHRTAESLPYIDSGRRESPDGRAPPEEKGNERTDG